MVKKPILAALFVFTLAIVLAGCSSNTDSSDGDTVSQSQAGQKTDQKNIAERYVRYDNGEGGVQVQVVWITPEYLKAAGGNELLKEYNLDENIVFEIGMTAHSGDLTKYPMIDKAELTIDDKVIKPACWDILSSDSHHPMGVLVFPANAAIEGSKLQLNLNDLNEIPDRTFIW